MSNLSYILKALLRRGPAFILLYLKESLAFDLLHGTNTHLRVPKSTPPGVRSEHGEGVLYVASLTSVVRRTLAQTESLLGNAKFREAQFFDLGCGKGKTLLVYAMLYGRVAKHPATGIEYEPSLCETAWKNIAGFKPATNRVDVHCDSALNVEQYVQSGTLVIYLYNPFGGETLRGVLTKISKYPHVLIYVDPVEKQTLAEYGYAIQAFEQGKHHANTWLIAVNKAVGRPPSANAGAAQHPGM
jgi:SAM-dependent methyltransferase